MLLMTYDNLIMSHKITVKKPKAIVLELTGALATREFMSYSEERRIHVKKNIGLYFAENYPRNKELRLDINFFKLQEANELREKVFNEACPKINDGTKKLPMPDVAINHIIWRLDNDKNSSALTLFLLHYFEWAYKKNLIITPVYDEVRDVLETWKNLDISIFVDVASAHFVNMILNSTTQGNLIPYFSGHMNLIQFDGQKTIRDFHLLPTMLYMKPSDILFITRFPNDAKIASDLGINTFLLVREDFHPEFKNLIKKAEETKIKEAERKNTNDESNKVKKNSENNNNKGSHISKIFQNVEDLNGAIENQNIKNNTHNSKNVEKSLTDVNCYASGLFTITSKIDELSKLSGCSLSVEQKTKLIAFCDSFEDPSQIMPKELANRDANSQRSESETDIRPTPSNILVNDLINIKYILNLSDLQFS